MTETRSGIGVQGNDVPTLLDRWARQGLLSQDQVERILRAEGISKVPAQRPAPAPEAGRNRLVVEALGYLGGVLAMAASLLLIQMLWEDLNIATRFAIPLVATAGLLLAGAMIPAKPDVEDGMTRLQSALWLLAVGAFTGAMGVLGDQIFEWEGRDIALLVGAGGAALALPLYLRTRQAAQQLGLFVTLVVTGCALGARADWDEPTIIGLVGWLVAVTWFVLGERRIVEPPIVATYLGAVAAIVTSMVMSESLGGQLLAVATVAALFVWGVRSDSLGLLAVASIGTINVVPSAVNYFFPDNTEVAVPLSLLAVGGVLVGTAVTVTRRRARRETLGKPRG